MKAILLASVLASIASMPAFAHPNHDADPMAPPKVMAAPKVRHTVEAAGKDGATQVTISRGAAKVDTSGALGVLVVQGRSRASSTSCSPLAATPW